jgi:hypothetical protein
MGTMTGGGLVWRKASRCTDATCVQVTWWKSSYSTVNGCIEVRHDQDRILIRDSKDPQGPVLSFTAEKWRAFTVGVRGGEFDQEMTFR